MCALLLSSYPLITYTFSFTGPSSLHDLGLGVGIVAPMAVDSEGPELIAIDASHLFAAHTAWLPGSAFAAAHYCASTWSTPRRLASHLDRRLINRAHRSATAADVSQLLEHVPLPVK